jgi:hypothetical protein
VHDRIRQQNREMKRGRKTLLTPQLQRRICKLLEQGLSVKTVCDDCEIGERTYFDWCQTNPAFSAACARARARGKIKLVAIVRRAANKDPKNAQWLLERLHPGEFGRAVAREPEQASAQRPIISNVYLTQDEHSEIARAIMYGDEKAKELMQEFEAMRRRMREREQKKSNEGDALKSRHTHSFR